MFFWCFGVEPTRHAALLKNLAFSGRSIAVFAARRILWGSSAVCTEMMNRLLARGVLRAQHISPNSTDVRVAAERHRQVQLFG